MGPNFPYHGRRPITKWLRKKYNVLDDNLSISKRKLKPASPPKMADNPVADTSAESDHEQQRHEEGGEAIHPSIFGAKAEFMSQYSKPIPLVRLSGDAFAQKEPARRYRLIRELRARREIALQAEYLGITSIPAKTFLVRHHHHQVLQGMGTMRAVNDPPKNSDLQEFGREPMDTVISNHQPTIASLLAGEISQSLVPTFNESKPSYETYSHLGKVGISAVAELDEAKFMERSHYTPPQNQAEIMEKLRLRKKDTCLIAHQQRRIIHPMKMPELQAKLHIKDLPLVIKRTGKKGAVKH